MATLLDSDSSDGEDEDFEGFVVSPEEKASYKAWTRKRRASHTFDSGSGSEDNLSGDEDDDEEEEDDEDDDDSESAGEGEEENEGLFILYSRVYVVLIQLKECIEKPQMTSDKLLDSSSKLPCFPL